MRTLFWFRSDLRTADNTGLLAACREAGGLKGGGVVALFVVSPGEWSAHDCAPVKIDFILRSLTHLSRDLAALNIPLVIAHAATADAVPGVVLKVCLKHNCDAIHANREYEVNESARDARLVSLTAAKKIPVTLHHDQGLVAPGSVLTGAGRPFTVFTPFKRAFLKSIAAHGGVGVLPAPPKQAPTGIDADAVPTTVHPFHSSVDPNLYPAGEKNALVALDAFCANRIARYTSARDLPADAGTSGLSHHLTVGTLSPRTCLQRAADANKGKFDGGSESVCVWISEILWREFYINILSAFPRVCKGRAFKPETDRIVWNTSADHLKAWQEGRTGVPIVDAGMRQLSQTGFMHNRVRMITAMYLTKNLFLNWRDGERWFMRHLIDGFLASNNGGWQWSASTGTDAAPYFRVMNPVSQSEKFDVKGDYIRRWVPELRALSNDAIHDPTSTVPHMLRTLGYPRSLVDLKESRRVAIEKFRAIRGDHHEAGREGDDTEPDATDA